MKLVHIIPTFNEKENIGRIIDILESLGKKYPQWETNILVVDDTSPENKKKIVQDYQNKFKNVYLLSKSKEGLGKALILGYEYAIKNLKADVVVPNDADFQWDPHDYPKLVQKIEEGYDVVVASRHVMGGKVIGWNWFRKLNHDVSNELLAWWIAGVHEVHDHAGNFKAIRVNGILNKVNLSGMKNAGFSFQLHILYELSKTNAKFYEVPVMFRERRFGKSKIGFNRYYFRDVLEYINNSLLIRLDRSKSFVKFCIVGLIGFIIQSIIAKSLITFRFHAGISVAIGAETAIISNFIFNNKWVFNHKKISGGAIFKKFIGFNMVSLGAIFIQGATVTVGTYFFGVSAWFITMVLSIAFLVVPYSFFMYNYFIWAKK